MGAGVVRNKCGQSVSQEWIDAMNWFLAYWCKSKKSKSYFNNFWVDLVKNGHGHLVHETLKSAEWVYALSWFFACWLWCNNFWLDQHRTFLSLTFKCQSAGVVLVSPLAVAGRFLWNSLSILPSWHLSVCFLRIWSWDLSEFCHGAGNPYEIVHDSPIFWKNFLCYKEGKWRKNRVFLIGKNWSQFSLNLFYNENIYYLHSSCTNPIFRKNLVPEV